MMNKKSLAILLIAGSFVNSAFANSIINKLITKHFSTTPAMLKTHKLTRLTHDSYTDFSGTWVGNCGDDMTMTTVIENDADSFSFDGYTLRIGHGLQGTHDSSEESSAYEHGSYEWNADRTALIIKSVGLIKNNTNNASIMTEISQFSLTMKNNQINLDGKVIMFEDLTPFEQPITLHCVFNRKQ